MVTIKITTNERGSFCAKLIQKCNDIWQQPVAKLDNDMRQQAVAQISEDVFFSVLWGYRGNAFR